LVVGNGRPVQEQRGPKHPDRPTVVHGVVAGTVCVWEGKKKGSDVGPNNNNKRTIKRTTTINGNNWQGKTYKVEDWTTTFESSMYNAAPSLPPQA
jgi:hypothetical protein